MHAEPTPLPLTLTGPVLLGVVFLVLAVVFWRGWLPLGSRLGIRTKATTVTRSVWDAAHRSAAPDFMALAALQGASAAAFAQITTVHGAGSVALKVTVWVWLALTSVGIVWMTLRAHRTAQAHPDAPADSESR